MLQFTQLVHGRQSAKCSDSQSSRPSSGKGSSSTDSETFSSSTICRKGKKF